MVFQSIVSAASPEPRVCRSGWIEYTRSNVMALEWCDASFDSDMFLFVHWLAIFGAMYIGNSFRILFLFASVPKRGCFLASCTITL